MPNLKDRMEERTPGKKGIEKMILSWKENVGTDGNDFTSTHINGVCGQRYPMNCTMELENYNKLVQLCVSTERVMIQKKTSIQLPAGLVTIKPYVGKESRSVRIKCTGEAYQSRVMCVCLLQTLL
jgi:hypothetical protein